MSEVDGNMTERLHALLSAQCERGLNEAEHAELELLVSDHADLRQLYIRYLFVHARLQEDYSRCSPQAPTGRFHEFDAAAAERPNSAANTSLPTVPPRDHRLRLNYQLIGSRIAVAASFYGVFSLLSWSLISGIQPPNNPEVEVAANPVQAALATLTASTAAQWKNSRPLREGTRLSADRYELISGTAEIRFDGGAMVSLQAPAILDLRSIGNCLLSRGRLTAVVPRVAHGFTVLTPTARIVDLGTEFGVVVDRTEATHVEVFAGEVLLSSVSRLDLSDVPLRLVAGEVWRVNSIGQIAAVAPRPEGFLGVDGKRKYTRHASRPASRGGSVEPDRSLWTVNTELPKEDASVSIESGLLRIVNRGYLISRQEYRPSPERPVRVTGKFYWVTPSDSFQLATRSDGMPGDEFGELREGLEFGYWPSHPEFTGILVRGDKLRIEDVRREGELDAIPGMVLAFELVDHGEHVRFAIWQSSLPQNRLTFTARVTHDAVLKHHVVLHNRERTEFENVLYVDGFQIEQPAVTKSPNSIDGNSQSRS